MAMWLLWIFTLAASFLLPATGEVVQSFSRCSQFFLRGKPPQLKPMNPARICQLYKNKYRFATMYDKDRRIPLFSAYKYQPGQGKRPKDWMIEPQLAMHMNHQRKSMELEETCAINYKLLEKNQAVERDYKGYDRGHLAPVCHQPDQDSKDATFTLTNIVPQFQTLNIGQWRIYEENINAAGCDHTYIIVGAVPGTKVMNNRVNVPSHIWAAGCCVFGKNKSRKSWAVIAENNKDKVVRLTLGQLQKQLAVLYHKKKIDLFNNSCNVIQKPSS